ncbi:Cas9 inhibitor AcrIIA9 family protein [Duncaniella muris]|uniref:Cas9 inhibitor AcrIIA9 family protein n=1 Tax=Duncaniella muris TaxID=2094150 RepID=UPI003F676807
MWLTRCRKAGLTIMDSDSVFSLILHYYDENLEDVPNVNCKIAVAKELTDTERAEARNRLSGASTRKNNSAKSADRTSRRQPHPSTPPPHRKQVQKSMFQPNLFEMTSKAYDYETENKKQEQILAMSGQLRPLTTAQMQWALTHTIDNVCP